MINRMFQDEQDNPANPEDILLILSKVLLEENVIC
jgi:hypothetical protein